MGRDRWPKTVREVALSHWPLRACGARRGRPAAQRTIPRRDWPRSSPHLRTVLSSEGTADTRSSHRPDHCGRTRELLPLVSGASAEDTFAALLWPVAAQEGHFPRQPRRGSLSDTNACVAGAACSERCSHIPWDKNDSG